VSAVHPWGFRPKESKALAPTESAFDESHRVSPDDVLITRANTSELVGASCLVTEEHPNLYLCDKTLRLIPTDSVRPAALVAVLNSPQARRQISEMGTGTSASMKNITQNDVRSIKVRWMALDAEQERIGVADQTLLRTARDYQAAKERLSALRLHMLTVLLSGEHAIPASYDELLEGVSA
jgi:type I restriction enzyme S subunit